MKEFAAKAGGYLFDVSEHQEELYASLGEHETSDELPHVFRNGRFPYVYLLDASCYDHLKPAIIDSLLAHHAISSAS